MCFGAQTFIRAKRLQLLLFSFFPTNSVEYKQTIGCYKDCATDCYGDDNCSTDGCANDNVLSWKQ